MIPINQQIDLMQALRKDVATAPPSKENTEKYALYTAIEENLIAIKRWQNSPVWNVDLVKVIEDLLFYAQHFTKESGFSPNSKVVSAASDAVQNAEAALGMLNAFKIDRQTKYGPSQNSSCGMIAVTKSAEFSTRLERLSIETLISDPNNKAEVLNVIHKINIRPGVKVVVCPDEWSYVWSELVNKADFSICNNKIPTSSGHSFSEGMDIDDDVTIKTKEYYAKNIIKETNLPLPWYVSLKGALQEAHDALKLAIEDAGKYKDVKYSASTFSRMNKAFIESASALAQTKGVKY